MDALCDVVVNIPNPILRCNSCTLLSKEVQFLYMPTLDFAAWPPVMTREEEIRAKTRFRKVTGDEESYLTRRTFKHLLGNATYALGLFNYIDTDGDCSVSCEEICEGITSFRASHSPASKLRVLYNYYDSDHDGMLSQSEVADAMRVASGDEDHLSSHQMEKLVHSIMDSFDKDKDGFLNFKEFCGLMRHAGLQYNL